MMVMTVMVIVTLFMVMMMPVVFATLRRDCQLAVKVRGDLLFHRCVWKTGAHGDAMMGEIGQGTVANPAGNDNLNTLLAQPARKRTGFVFRRRQHVGVQRHFLFRVHLNQRKLATTAEAAVQTSVFNGNGNFHDSNGEMNVGLGFQR